MANTTFKGDLAVLKVLTRCVEKGVTASRPTTECSRYDLILDVENRLWRTQVKYGNGKSSRSQGVTTVRIASYNLGSGTKTYSRREEIWEGKTVVFLRHEPAKNGQSKGCIEAAKYEW